MINNENLIYANQCITELDYMVYNSEQVSDNVAYNGWTNKNTWLLNLNLTNIYGLIKPLEANIKDMSIKDFIIYVLVNAVNLADTINFEDVNYNEIYNKLKESC